MRTLLVGVLAAAAAFLQAPAAPPPAAGSLVLTGLVVTGSGQDVRPVRRARVTLTGGPLKTARMTDTDTKGAYRFDRLAKAAYHVSVQKAGFVTLEAQAAPGVTLTMVRGAAIEGVVTDQTGTPMMNLAVSALRRQPDGATKTAAQTRTDDLGRYRLHSLGAGDYLVQAAVDRAFIFMTTQAVGGYPSDEDLSHTTAAYYPATTAIDDATAIHVSAGSNASGIDISLTPDLLTVDKRPLRPAPQPAGTGRLSGRLTDRGSGKPILRARVELVSLGNIRNGRMAITDSNGRFAFPGLDPQMYTIRADATGFIAAAYGRTRPEQAGLAIDVPADQQVTADMSLQRTSAVEGTLTDEFGDPAPGIFVQLAHWVSLPGRRLMEPDGGVPQPTDDRGHYRVPGLEPGDYYAAALSGPFVALGRPTAPGSADPPASQDGVGGFATTWYPGTSDAGAGLPISVAPGADNVSVSFALASARTVSVSGTMVGPDGRPVNGGMFSLAASDRLKHPEIFLARGKTSADGQFLFRNVPPGAYTLQGCGLAEPGPQSRGESDLNPVFPFGSMHIVVGDSDVDELMLTVTRGTTLSGRIVLDDANGAPLSPQQVRIWSIPAEFDSPPPCGFGDTRLGSETHEDWTFAVSHLFGRQSLVVNVSPTWMLKRVTRTGIDITDEAVDFSETDVADVEVVLTSKVTRVSGAVSDDKGPVREYAVVIFSSDPNEWIAGFPPRHVVLARHVGENGFEARSLPPDDYLAVALPSVGETEWTDPEFLQAVRPLATSFTLQEGESKTLALKLKTRP